MQKPAKASSQHTRYHHNQRYSGKGKPGYIISTLQENHTIQLPRNPTPSYQTLWGAKPPSTTQTLPQNLNNHKRKHTYIIPTSNRHLHTASYPTHEPTRQYLQKTRKSSLPNTHSTITTNPLRKRQTRLYYIDPQVNTKRQVTTQTPRNQTLRPKPPTIEPKSIKLSPNQLASTK